MPEILIYGIVGDSYDGLDAKTLVPIISAGDDPLDLRINSPGGFVMEGLAIFNAVSRARQRGRKVTTHVDGLAASMASVIAMAGDEIIMADNALMMIHNPWDVATGDAPALRAAADQLDLIRDQMVGIYGAVTGIDTADLVAMLNAETWLDAEDALAQKFCTSIMAASSAAACDVTAFGFRKVPETPRISALAMIGKPKAAAAVVPPPKETEMPEGTTAAEPTGAQNKTDTSVVALTAADVQNAVAAERTRVSAIRALGAKHKLDDGFIDGLVAGDTTLAAAREQVLDKLAERSDAMNIGGNGQIVVTADARSKWIEGASAWLMVRAGVAPIVERAAKMKGETLKLDPGEFRGVSNVELARESLGHAGIRVSSRDPNTIVGSAMTVRNAITQTTGDFSVLLENVMHKTLQASYAVTPDTWSMVAGTGTVTDFRVANRYLRGTFGALDNVNEAGEFKNKPIPDGAKQTIQAGTKGNIINLSRQAIINDDMGVFSDLATELGRAAKLTIEIDFYALLNSNPTMTDGYTLFSSQHANIAATAGPPGVATFDAARVQMAQQKDVSGNEFLEIRPNVWLGPIGIGGLARIIVGSPYDPDATNKLQRPNIVQGLISTVVDTPRLAGTAWYMFADKDVAPAIEVVFLNGVQEPFLDNELGWRVDGTEWKVRLDYGVGAVNWRSVIKNAGA